MSVLTRQMWNEIIQAINALALSPPPGCEPLSPLPEVPVGHRWSKSDISDAQDKLAEICEDNTFSDMPEKWKQSIVDELNEVIGRGWCGCSDDDGDCTPEDEAEARSEHGMSFTVLSITPAIHSNCNGNPLPPDTTANTLVNGFPLGMPGFASREWKLRRKIGGVYSPGHVSSGTVACDGTVQVGGFDRSIQQWAGIGLFCSNCETVQCAEAHAEAEAASTGGPDVTLLRPGETEYYR